MGASTYLQVYSHYTLQWTGTSPSKVPLSVGDLDPTEWFLEPTQVYIINGILIVLAVFAQFTVVPNTQADIQTMLHTISSNKSHLCTVCRRCGFIIAIILTLCSKQEQCRFTTNEVSTVNPVFGLGMSMRTNKKYLVLISKSLALWHKSLAWKAQSLLTCKSWSCQPGTVKVLIQPTSLSWMLIKLTWYLHFVEPSSLQPGLGLLGGRTTYRKIVFSLRVVW